MKALTLTQPWASLVAIGAKSIETRSWSTPYRGRLVIHAAKNVPSEAVDFAFDSPAYEHLFKAELVNSVYDVRLKELREEMNLPLGMIVAIANLHRVGVIVENDEGDVFVRGRDLPVTGNELHFGNYDEGRFGWILTNVQRLDEPIPCRGHLGVWDVPADVEAQIDAQLAVQERS